MFEEFFHTSCSVSDLIDQIQHILMYTLLEIDNEANPEAVFPCSSCRLFSDCGCPVVGSFGGWECMIVRGQVFLPLYIPLGIEFGRYLHLPLEPLCSISTG